MIHKDLVNLAETWLKDKKTEDEIQFLLPCGAVISKSGSSATEQPYAIGFSKSTSILIECILNDADYQSNKLKILTNDRDKLGDFRFYLAPKGVISAGKIQNKFGLLEVTGSKVNMLKEPEYIGAQKEVEVALLASVVRRFQKKSLSRKKSQ